MMASPVECNAFGEPFECDGKRGKRQLRSNRPIIMRLGSQLVKTAYDHPRWGIFACSRLFHDVCSVSLVIPTPPPSDVEQIQFSARLVARFEHSPATPASDDCK